ncbi:unnamed protein product [Discula destructiva]
MFANNFLLLALAIFGMFAQLVTASVPSAVGTVTGPSNIVNNPEINNSISLANIDDVSSTDGVLAPWGRLCDSIDCNNCGQWVDLGRSDCLSGEAGRQSAQLKTDGPSISVALVYTPGDSCNCQSYCQPFPSGGCYQLDNLTLAAQAHSYRWVNFGDLLRPCGNTNTNC